MSFKLVKAVFGQKMQMMQKEKERRENLHKKKNREKSEYTQVWLLCKIVIKY